MRMAETRKQLRDELMHSSGTTAYETILVIIPSLFYTTAANIIISLMRTYTENHILQFCIEFLIIVIPMILNFTIMADHTLELLVTSFMICISLIILIQGSTPIKEKRQTKLDHVQDYITNSRSTINILSVIAILAVDFLVFPRKFAKTKNFGYSLMDVGVGLFIYSNGVVDGGKTCLWKSLKGCFPLLILGLFRFLIVKQIDYHVPVTEYGVHWNFFLTLAVTKLFVSLILNTINVRFIWINATLLMISHEVLLETGLKNFVISNTKRTDFIKANKEGLVSSMGYVSLYLFSVYFSYLLNWKKESGKIKVVLKFIFLSSLTLLVSLVCQKYFGISRKLANSAYCFWILFIGLFMSGLFYIVNAVLVYTFKNKLVKCLYSPLIFQAINYNGLVFFLISNLLTGLINILCDTLKVSTIISLAIISIYMFINCLIVCILYKKKMKLKL